MGIEDQIGIDGITGIQTGKENPLVKKRRTTSIFEVITELRKPEDPKTEDKLQTGTREVIKIIQSKIEPGNQKFAGDYENILGTIRQDLYTKPMSEDQRTDALNTLEKLRTYLITPNSNPDQ